MFLKRIREKVRRLSKSFPGYHRMYDSRRTVAGRSIAVGLAESARIIQAEQTRQLPEAKEMFYRA